MSRTLVRASYGAAFGYVFADVIDKAQKTYARESAIQTSQDSPRKKTLKVASDCLLWQTFASVLLPGFTINRICKLSLYLMNKSNVKPLIQSSKVLTTGIGLLSIPLIIHPIDHAVHVAMDKTVRPAIGVELYYKENDKNE